MKRAVVVGTGAGGATAAKELQAGFEVTILEEGKEFHPFASDLSFFEGWKKTGLLFDEREIQLFFPAMRIRRTAGRMVLVNGRGIGGTTPLSTGSALRLDKGLKKVGVDLEAEFRELSNEIPRSTAHEKRWRPATRQLFGVCSEMRLSPSPTPKMGNYELCRNCGRCVLGCPQGVKWDSRRFLEIALGRGAKLVAGAKVMKVEVEKGRASGIWARKRGRKVFHPADLVVLAAGGFGTPAILERSGLRTEPNLFVDPLICVAAEWKEALQNKEVSMPFVVEQEHFLFSPYFDHLSFFFNRKWKFPAKNILSLMIKLADNSSGTVSGRKVRKALTDEDRRRLQEGVALCMEIFRRLGVPRERLFHGTINAGHPGGMLPLSEREAEALHHSHLPENLYLADSTLFPNSLGGPPILTITALAKRISRRCLEKLA